MWAVPGGVAAARVALGDWGGLRRPLQGLVTAPWAVMAATAGIAQVWSAQVAPLVVRLQKVVPRQLWALQVLQELPRPPSPVFPVAQATLVVQVARVAPVALPVRAARVAWADEAARVDLVG